MATYRTPDVYVEEIPVFPPSVAEVETAIPAFIGYTQKAEKITTDDLLLKPTKIYSMKEFERYYGFPKDDTILIKIVDVDGGYKVDGFTPPTLQFILYYAIKMFFDNGGGKCYIVSVGNYADPLALSTETEPPRGLQIGLDAVALEDEPTLLVIPEAIKLQKYADYRILVQKMLDQCDKLRDRFAILDLWNGDKDIDQEVEIAEDTKKKLVEANRDAWSNNLKYGAAYYPFLKTAMNYWVKESDTKSNVSVNIGSDTAVDLATLRTSKTSAYNAVKAGLRDYYVVVSPSAAVAGVYAATDTNRGVWKAPANVSLGNVIEPVVKLDNDKQGDLNVDPTTGKSINALRAFSGKGTLVWGARTLAGNDNEWRYVSVRRFFNMVEESVKKSTYWAVFEPNDANTWVKVRGMIENYLMQKWREGALAGATTEDAFFVKCGLGTTMTAQDILEGRMNVEIGMAVVRPAEFIILKFSHKMQTS